MCGIIGYVGENNAVPYLLKGLKKLEYRGYDSSGIALLKAGEIFLLKRQGKISELEKAVSPSLFSFCGIGHTRWATHGEPSAKNAHPHLSKRGIFAVVHNGIIENAGVLKRALEEEGYRFLSDTDTEVVCHLLEKNNRGNPSECLRETVKVLEGSYALAVIHKDCPRTIFCAKKDSPLLIGKCAEGSFVFSDCTAVSEYCNSYFSLEDYEFAEVTRDTLTFFDCDGNIIKKAPKKIASKCVDSEKNGFPHYMLKEIYEQPAAFRSTIEAYCDGEKISFPLAKMTSSEVKNIDRIHIIGCGSAYHAGVYGKYIIEELTGICTTAEIASEFRYGRVPLNEKSLVIIISQSGETADSLAALNLAQSKGAKTLCIVNVQSSTMAEKAHMFIHTKAGTEIAVATTKAYLCQVAVIYLSGLYLGEKRGTVRTEDLRKSLREISALYENIELELRSNGELSAVAEQLQDAEHIYFIGRHTDYALALEGSLKLKEISYIHCEAYPAGELKHGTISLIEKGTPVIAVCLREDVFAKTLSAVKEVKARGAEVIVLTREDFRSSFEENDKVITVKYPCSDALSLIVGAVSLQLLSYHIAVKRGCEVDKPRNLAKSVTVE